MISLDPLASHHALHLFQLQTQSDLIVHPSSAPSSKFISKSRSTPKPTQTPNPSSTGNTTFDTQKAALETYRDLLYRSDRQNWRIEWEELVEGEMGGWQYTGAGEVEEMASPGGKGKKGGRGRGGSVELGD